MAKRKSKRESTKAIVPQARRVGAKARRRAAPDLASSVFFNRRGELVIRDERLAAKLRKKLNRDVATTTTTDVAAEIVIEQPQKPIPPPKVNGMCICRVRSFDLRERVRDVPGRTGGSGGPL